MHGLPSLVTDLGLILLLAAFTTLLCRKFNQPLVLGYILAGFLCGPVVDFLPTIADQENIELWSEIGVIFLMFAVGLEFSIHKLVKVGLAGILSALFEVGGMMFLGITLGQILGWTMMDSIFLGGMLSISSTMIAIKSLEDSGLKSHKFAGYAIGTLIIEDIVAIFMMVILSTVAVSQGISGWELMFSIAELLFYLALWLMLGIFLLPTLLNKVRDLLTDEMLLVLSLGICFGMVWIADALGFSSALGAFLAGSILAGTLHSDKIEHLVAPCKDLFGAVFFVSVGLLVVPETLIEYLVPILLITVITVVGKIIFLTLGMMAAGKDIATSVKSAFCLTQIGEFSYIIAALGTSLGVTSDFLYPVIVAVSVITAFTTPLMIGHAESFADWLAKAMPEKLRLGWEKYGNNDDDSALQDSDWIAFGKGYLTSLVLYTLISLGIIMIGIKLVAPLLTGISFGNLLVCAMIELGIMPFVGQLLLRRDPNMTSLWLKGIKNRLPLLVMMLVRVMTAMLLLILPLYWMIHFHPVWVVLGGILLTVLLFRFRRFTSMYLKIEAKFLANFNERKLQEQYAAGGRGSFGLGFNESVFVGQFICPEGSSIEGQTLIQLDWGRMGVKVIKIVRDRQHINIPEGTEKICAGDMLWILSDAKTLANFKYICRRRNTLQPLDEAEISLHDYIEQQGGSAAEQIYCCAVSIADVPRYAGKTIRESSLKQDWSCFLLGLERDKLPINNPSPEMRLESGDLVWVLGSQQMGEQLVAEGVV